MSSIIQGSSTAVSVMTSDADHSSTARGKNLHSIEIKSLPLKKRPLVSVKTGKKASKKKQRQSKPKEKGPLSLGDEDPAQRVGFLRSLPIGYLFSNESGIQHSTRDQAIPTQEEESTDLALCNTWPWKIQKKLRASDLNIVSRLLLPKAGVKSFVLPLMSDEMLTQIGSREGMRVTVQDLDTCSDHPLVFKYWKTSGSFVLNGSWVDKFVNRRGLKVGDEIGLFWNWYDQKFVFTVLEQGSSYGLD